MHAVGRDENQGCFNLPKYIKLRFSMQVWLFPNDFTQDFAIKQKSLFLVSERVSKQINWMVVMNMSINKLFVCENIHRVNDSY